MPFKDKNKYKNYMKKYMKKRWTGRRKEVIEYLGGKCEHCGSEDSLEFDHKSKKKKRFTLADFTSKNDEDFWNEVRKCRLLCRPCHEKRTAEQNRKKASINIKIASRIAGI